MSVALAQAGASVLATDLDPSAAAETQRLLGGPVELVGQPLDVTDPASIAAGIEHLVSATGRLDILVNNAGINIGNDTPAEDLDPRFGDACSTSTPPGRSCAPSRPRSR